MSRSEDTIFAQATPPGRSAIAVIRISGQQALAVPALFGADCPQAGSFSLARLFDRHGKPLDEALLLAMKGPRSSTGEDVLEIHAHGSIAVVSSILDHLSEAPGFRVAEPGEFTQRMFAHDKIDLIGAEALADLIDAETDLQLNQAWRHKGGMLSGPVSEWRDLVITLGGRLEALIDFADEDLPPDVESDLRERVSALCTRIQHCLDDDGMGEAIREGVTVSLIGPVNAGKSSLLNMVAGRDAAIVSDEAGTTRDIVSIRVNLDGVPITIQDTAGVRETLNVIEAEGIRRAVEAGRNADAALLVVDGSEPDWRMTVNRLRSEVTENHRVIVNKIDRGVVGDLDPDMVGVSLLTAGDHKISGAILNLLRDMVFPANRDMSASIITRARHRHALQAALEALEAAGRHDLHLAPEMAAEDLRQAVDALGRIIGRVDVEDLLSSIFSSFCIGK